MSVFKKTDRYRENINDMVAVGKLMTKKRNAMYVLLDNSYKTVDKNALRHAKRFSNVCFM